MEFIVYRGIDYAEACKVVNQQKYQSEERKHFLHGLSAKAVFGSGLYLVSDLLVAVEYAFCHAEASNQKAAVLRQQLHMDNPIQLSGPEGEGLLREKALNWKHPEGYSFEVIPPVQEYISWSGRIIKEYLLSNGYDGIQYCLHEHFTYFVSYYPEQHVTDIRVELVFDLDDIQITRSSRKLG